MGPSKLQNCEQLIVSKHCPTEAEHRLRMLIHDLRSPLTLIQVMTGLLEQQFEKINQRKCQDSGRRMNPSGLALPLGAFANGDEIKHLLTLEPAQLPALMSACRRMVALVNDALIESTADNNSIGGNPVADRLLWSDLKIFIMEKQIEYQNDPRVMISLKGPNVTALRARDFRWPIGRDQILRILSNLINNSVEARRLEQIEIQVRIDGQMNLVISDNGRGIPAEVLAQLGRRPLSHGKEKLQESGSGLGIYGAQRCLSQYGVRMEIESAENEGTQVRIVFPDSLPTEAPKNKKGDAL